MTNKGKEEHFVLKTAFFNICKLWELSEKEQSIVLNMPESELNKFIHCKDVTLCEDTLNRILYVIDIFKALNTLLPNPERADSWIKTPNSAPLFKGVSALNILIEDSKLNLILIRDYLYSYL